VPFLTRVDARYLRLCTIVLIVQAIVGLLGFGLHAAAIARQSGATLLGRILSGAPPMAPLLFPNLVVLGLIALRVLAKSLEPRQPAPSR
jgi:hypothetical protein